MSTVKVIFNEGKINKIGEVPIWLRITKDRKPSYISLGIKVLKSQWNYETNKVRKSHPNSQWINKKIAQKVAEAENKALQSELSVNYTSSKKITKNIKGLTSISFTKYAEKSNEKLKRLGKLAMYYNAKGVLAKLKIYVDEREIQFTDLTPTFLGNYENYLLGKGNNQNTVANGLRIIRKIFNEAIREEIVDFNKNPFIIYRIKTAPTAINYLTEVELDLIANLKLNPSKSIYHFRNLYIFAANTGGIRISDLLLLKWSSFDGAKLSFVTKKTKAQINIKVPSKGLAILNLYKKADTQPTDFIFPFFKNDIDYSIPQNLYLALNNTIHKANTALKDIATECKINKNLHFHTSRHTWATQALLKGVRIEYVSKLMTHTNIKTTQVYAKIVDEELDKAMDLFN